MKSPKSTLITNMPNNIKNILITTLLIISFSAEKSFAQSFPPANILYGSSNNNSEEKSGIFSTLNDLQNSKALLIEKNALIEFEKNQIFPETNILETLNNLDEKIENLFENLEEKKTKTQKIESELSELEAELLTLQNSAEKLKEDISPTSSQAKEEKSKTLNQEINDQEQLIFLKKEELQVLEKAEASIQRNLQNSYILLTEKYKEFPKINLKSETFTAEFQEIFSNEVLNLQDFLIKTKANIAGKEVNKQNIIDKTQLEIEVLNHDIQQLQTTYKGHLWKIAINVASFVGLLLFIFLIKIFSHNALNRIADKVKVKNIDTLNTIHKWFFYITFTLAFLIYFSSAFSNFLPFLAILGTALAFALREVLISFIAWFIIEMKDGYKVGDIIKVGKVFGEVKEITPLLTVIHQHGLNGETGKILTFPNKKIFEVPVQNWSKRRGFIYITLEFFLEADSNFERAEVLLRKSIEEENQLYYENAKKHINWFKRSCKLDMPNIEAQIFFEADQRGILLRGKVFTDIYQRHYIRNKIMKNFMAKAKIEGNINFRFINIAPGGNI